MAQQSMTKTYLGLAMIILFSLGAVGAQAWLGAAPKYDKETVKDLETLRSDIDDQVRSDKALPVSLAGIKTKLSASRLTERGVEYRLVNSTKKYSTSKYYSTDYKYELCAVFKTNTLAKKTSSYQSDTYFNPSYHDKGRFCFTGTTYLYN